MARYIQKPGRGKLNTYSAFEKRGLINSELTSPTPGHPKLRRAVNKVKSNIRAGVQNFKSMSPGDKALAIGAGFTSASVSVLAHLFNKQKKERQDPNWR
tara:strand:+ start:86 stop:382 length:297 start_codon:yes stop_codon:yes gene_type:complete